VATIAGLAATGLASSTIGNNSSSSSTSSSSEGSPVAEETPTGLLTFDAPGDAKLDPSKEYNAFITTDQGDIVIALNPDAPEAINSLAFLASKHFYDGLEFFWVAPGFDIQTGDPTCESSGELTCTGTGGPGYDLPKEGDATQADEWTVIAPATSQGSDRVHGSQFAIALRDEMEFEGTIIGKVVKGQNILQDVESRGKRAPCFGAQPISSCQTADELPPPLSIKSIAVQPA
jgi:cyclophilin family peptidyl-prolyl cis-trans isomerase